MSMRGTLRESDTNTRSATMLISPRVWPLHTLSPEERRSTKVRTSTYLFATI